MVALVFDIHKGVRVELEPRYLFKFIGQQMDYDLKHNLFGSAELNDIAWLNHAPKTYEETIENMYERLRALGVELTFKIETQNADKFSVAQAEITRIKSRGK